MNSFRVLVLVLGSALLVAVPGHRVHAQSFEGRPAIADDQLDQVRGGFVLPNGMDVGLGISVDTLINGQLAVSTVLTVDDVAHLSVYSGPKALARDDVSALLVRGPEGGPTVRITQDAPSSRAAAGAQPVALSAGAPPVQTPWGAVQLVQSDTQATVSLVGDGFEVRQMIGGVTGALVANTVGGQVIDTMVTVDVDVRHSAIPAGAMALRLEGVLADAAALRALR